MRQITVEPPAKVGDGKVVIPIQFPTFRVNLTVEEADQLKHDLGKAVTQSFAIIEAR
jgi:hypothetical protein